MPLITVGVSHHTAPLDIRERLAFARADYGQIAVGLNSVPGVSEAVVLSTCNRTEVYALAAADRQDGVRDWLRDQGGLDEIQAETHFYTHTGREAIRHLYRVACGLDSMVLGEPQIIGQLKESWQAAREAGSAGKITDRLFQRAFAASKQVRNHTGINDHPVSVAYIATVLAQQIFGDLASQTVLMIGAGEMIELCGRHFSQQGLNHLVIANRSLDKAQELAGKFGAEALSLADISQQMPLADIIISSTSSREPVIVQSQVKAAIEARRHRPMFMVDLGVPRDIDPAVAQMNDVYLYTIDDLQQVADDNLDQRRQAADAAGNTIDEAVDDFLRWSHGARAARSLHRLRQHAESNGSLLADRARRQIEAGGDPGKIVTQLANTLVHKILHGPSERLRAAAEQEQYDLLEAADWLFDSSAEDPGLAAGDLEDTGSEDKGSSEAEE